MDSAQRFSLFRYAAPNMFYPLAGVLAPWFMGVAVVLTVIGLYLGFFVAPTDAVQGEVYRVIFIHVPAAWMSMFIYLVMAFWSAVGVVFNTRLSAMMAQALALSGSVAFQKSDFARASSEWERILVLLPPENELAQSIRQGIAEARQRGNLPPLAELRNNFV